MQEVARPSGYSIDNSVYFNQVVFKNINGTRDAWHLNPVHSYYTTYDVGGNTVGLALETPLKGGFELCKADSDGREWQTHSLTGDDIIDKEGHQAQGSATLEGAEFEVYNRSTYKVEHNGVVYEPGERIETLTTDVNGYTYIDDLPAGVYDCVEVKAPDGYKLHPTKKENTTTVTLVDDNGVIKMKDATGAHASVDSN